MYKNCFKRVLSFIIALIAVLLLALPLAIITLWLTIVNKGAGAFYTQARPGYKGKIFNIIKFKSMTDETDAEGNLLPDEKRITAVGAFIRKTSIDELPQLFNILKGDMVFVGPRPLMISYLDLYSTEQARRHDVRPGITGWAQCNGRNNITWTKKFELDLWYVDHVSVWLDIKILLLTACKVIKRTDIDCSSEKVGSEDFNGHN